MTMGRADRAETGSREGIYYTVYIQWYSAVSKSLPKSKTVVVCEKYFTQLFEKLQRTNPWYA